MHLKASTSCVLVYQEEKAVCPLVDISEFSLFLSHKYLFRYHIHLKPVTRAEGADPLGKPLFFLFLI